MAPIAKALDERALKIADGLAAADKAKTDLAAANKRVEQELAQTRNETASRLADAERRAQAIIEEAKARASEEATRLLLLPAPRPSSRQSRPVKPCASAAALAVKGAEQILRKEVDAGVHADLLNRLKTEL